MQVVELIILAVLAGVVLFQLYAVLGRKVGRGPEAAAPAPLAPTSAPRAPLALAEDATPLSGVAALRARDASFDPSQFLQGARAAYQQIVKAFAEGDRAVLRPLLAPTVMASFEAAIARREGEGRSESVEFLQPPRADLDSVSLVGDIARAAVRFLAELRNRSRDAAGEAVDDHRTAEVWTFERNVKSHNPNWTLIHVDAAEA
ncbi:MAG TPA: TIM44-related membrane protein TimA [Caulobacteraceae bacterium]|nr:TIM44-related membrane protein TimA [Caulobacteraceae bacterium]